MDWWKKSKYSIWYWYFRTKKIKHKILKKRWIYWNFQNDSDSTLEGIIIYDENKKCIQVNKVATKLLGFSEEEMFNKDALYFISHESIDLVNQVIKKDNQEAYEALMKRKDGSTFPAIFKRKRYKSIR